MGIWPKIIFKTNKFIILLNFYLTSVDNIIMIIETIKIIFMKGRQMTNEIQNELTKWMEEKYDLTAEQATMVINDLEFCERAKGRSNSFDTIESAKACITDFATRGLRRLVEVIS
jgi:hypothetical protein